jgi:hypothetical protein
MTTENYGFWANVVLILGKLPNVSSKFAHIVMQNIFFRQIARIYQISLGKWVFFLGKWVLVAMVSTGFHDNRKIDEQGDLLQCSTEWIVQYWANS